MTKLDLHFGQIVIRTCDAWGTEEVSLNMTSEVCSHEIYTRAWRWTVTEKRKHQVWSYLAGWTQECQAQRKDKVPSVLGALDRGSGLCIQGAGGGGVVDSEGRAWAPRAEDEPDLPQEAWEPSVQGGTWSGLHGGRSPE
jgi:hypothetical protein